MPVYFVYRSPYGNPGGRHVRRFDADTVLDWFRSIWRPIPEAGIGAKKHPAWDHAKELIGRSVYSFGSLFTHIHEHSWPPPSSMEELADDLQSALYVNEMSHGPHYVQILTDDDELDMAIYVFDDHYVKKHRDRAAFLTGEDWRLPDGAADGPFRPKTQTPKAGPPGAWEGTTYFASTYHGDGGSLEDLNDCRDQHRRFAGVRLPDLPRYLLTAPEFEGWGSGYVSLRAAVQTAADRAKGDERAFLTAVRNSPHDDAAWAAYSDWLEERGKPPAGRHLLERALRLLDPGQRGDAKPRKNRYAVADHVAQACLHTGAALYDEDTYQHWVLFDDRWAAAHPDLADSILRFMSRWDPL